MGTERPPKPSSSAVSGRATLLKPRKYNAARPRESQFMAKCAELSTLSVDKFVRHQSVRFGAREAAHDSSDEKVAAPQLF